VVYLLWFAAQTKRGDKGIYIMTTEKTTLNRLITISQYYLFSRELRKIKNLNIHHINILISLYLLQEVKKDNDITLHNIVLVFGYLSYNQLKKIIVNLIPSYVLYKDGKYYSLSLQGVVLVEDILSGYDSIFRAFMEKHKFNELF